MRICDGCGSKLAPYEPRKKVGEDMLCRACQTRPGGGSVYARKTAQKVHTFHARVTDQRSGLQDERPGVDLCAKHIGILRDSIDRANESVSQKAVAEGRQPHEMSHVFGWRTSGDPKDGTCHGCVVDSVNDAFKSTAGRPRSKPRPEQISAHPFAPHPADAAQCVECNFPADNRHHQDVPYQTRLPGTLSSAGPDFEYEEALKGLHDHLMAEHREGRGAHPGDFADWAGKMDAVVPEHAPGTFEREWSDRMKHSSKDERFQGVSLKQDDDGWYVTTHRARSDSYPSPEEIPDSKIKFIESTGALSKDQNECDHNGPHNAHGQCKACGYSEPTEGDEPCDNEWCVKHEPDHTKAEHIDPSHLDRGHPDYQSAEHAINDALGEHAWLLDTNHQGPGHLSKKVASAEEEPKKYLRFGDWHPSETSRNYVTGDIEHGVSVYDLDPDTNEPVSPDIDRADTDWGHEDMHNRINQWRAGDLPAHVVSGEHVGYGHDGEPLLQKVKHHGPWGGPANKTSALSKKKADEWEPPTVSGVALRAADTGRMLMIQRSLKDEKDPARGTWEFPGGHHEDGDKSSLHAGIREWEEEVGHPFPEGGSVTHTWRSGPYQGHVVTVPEESCVDFSEGRRTTNPDDPDNDDHEQSAWWDPEHARKNPALRQEVKDSWKDLAPGLKHDAVLNPYVAVGTPPEGATFRLHEQDTGGSRHPVKHTLVLQHPEHVNERTGDPQVMGHVEYFPPKRKDGRVVIRDLNTKSEYTRQGVASALMDEVQRRHPEASIDHGERTTDGKAWWQGYTDGKSVRRGRTAAQDDEYRMSHRPPSGEEDSGAPFHKAEEVMPDVHEHPEWYRVNEHYGRETHQQLKAAKGNPDHPVNIYRALPKEHTTFRPGDWVTPSSRYADTHRYSEGHEEPEDRKWHVIKATVPAKHLHSHGDSPHEWGYTGSDTIQGEIHHDGPRRPGADYQDEWERENHPNPQRMASADHDVLYHLTDKHYFALDPEHAPHDNTFAIQDRSGTKGLYGVSEPHGINRWRHGEGYQRPYVAEIHAPKGLARDERWGGEKFLPAEHFDKAKVHRVMPVEQHEQETYYPNGRTHAHEMGDIERHAGSPAPGEGKDVRDFTPEEHTEHLHRLRNYLHDVHGWGWNEFNDKHEHVGTDETNDDGEEVRRGRDGNVMTRSRYASRTASTRCPSCGGIELYAGEHEEHPEHHGTTRLHEEPTTGPNAFMDHGGTTFRSGIPQGLTTPSDMPQYPHLNTERFKMHPNNQGPDRPAQVNIDNLTDDFRPLRHSLNTLELDMNTRIALTTTAGQRIVVVAHDSGDGQTIYHCPFCGSGQVIARSDRTIECEFCHTSFTVQVQPQFSAFPQTIDGQPVDVPGMPGQIDSPMDPDALGDDGSGADFAGPPGPDNQPPWLQDDSQDQQPPMQQAAARTLPPWTAGQRTFSTAKGDVLVEDQYVRHLAVLASGKAPEVLKQVKAAATS